MKYIIILATILCISCSRDFSTTNLKNKQDVVLKKVETQYGKTITPPEIDNIPEK